MSVLNFDKKPDRLFLSKFRKAERDVPPELAHSVSAFGVDSKGGRMPSFGAGSSNRERAASLLAGESKGDSVPLAGRIQRNRRFRGTRTFEESLVCYTFAKGMARKRVDLPSASERASQADCAVTAERSQHQTTV